MFVPLSSKMMYLCLHRGKKMPNRILGMDAKGKGKNKIINDFRKLQNSIFCIIYVFNTYTRNFLLLTQYVIILIV